MCMYTLCLTRSRCISTRQQLFIALHMPISVECAVIRKGQMDCISVIGRVVTDIKEMMMYAYDDTKDSTSCVSCVIMFLHVHVFSAEDGFDQVL